MVEEPLESVTFDCPGCGVRISQQYATGVPDHLECPSCGETFAADEIAGLENTVRTEMPDTDQIGAVGWDVESSGRASRVDDTIDEMPLEGSGLESDSGPATDPAEADETIEAAADATTETRTSETTKMWTGEASVGEPSRESDAPESRRGEAENERHRLGGGGTDEPTEVDTGRSGTWRVVGALAALAVLLGGAVLLVEWRSSGGNARTVRADTGATPDGAVDTRESVASAVAAAARRLRSGYRIDPSDPQLQRRVARRLAASGRNADAAAIFDLLWDKGRGEMREALLEEYLAALEAADRWGRLRRVIVEAVQMHPEERAEGLRRRYRESIRSDPLLGAVEPVRIGEELDVESIERAETLDVRGWVLRRDGAPTHVFRPAASDGPDWRDDVAAWRLCRILSCPFEVPRTRPATIRRERLEGLAGEAELPEDLRWRAAPREYSGEARSENEEDGEDRPPIVYGSLREWPGEVARWPIERDEVWRQWLTTWEETDFDRSAIEALRRAWGSDGDAFVDGVARHLDGVTVGEAARQLSATVTFDYLVNNWGRFAEEPARWGSQNHVGDGRFVTLSTDTVFQLRKSTRVRGRFHWIHRFSRDLVTAIRLLPRDPTFAALYPEPTAADEQKLEIFWEQRGRLLERVASLTEEHGREEVLFFE